MNLIKPPMHRNMPSNHAKTAVHRRTIYLLRHAEPQLAPGGKRYTGWSDPPLSAAGARQATGWQPVIAALDLTAIFCSDLQRSRQTAERIIAPGTLHITIEPALREINLGQWEGETFEAVRRQDPEGFARRGRDPVHYRPPGGESFDDLQQRVMPAFDKIIAGCRGDILIVGHAGVNRVILCRLLGMPLANLFRIGQDYAALNIIAADTTGYRVQALNYRLHMDLTDQNARQGGVP